MPRLVWFLLPLAASAFGALQQGGYPNLRRAGVVPDPGVAWYQQCLRVQPRQMPVRELVAFGRFPHSGGRLTPADHRLVDEAMAWFELGPLADRHLDQLSGGQRQRAYVAMVMCQGTDHVLLDEPLNNLDMRHAVQMMRMLRGMADELGRTVVLVVHDVNVASCYSDRIVAIREGQLVAEGPTSELMTPELLRKVFDVEVEVHELAGRRIGVPWS